MHTSDILIDNFVIIVIKHTHAHTHQTALNLIRWMEVADSVYAKESCEHTTTTTWENRAQHQPWLKVNPYSLKYIIVFVLVGFSTSSHLKCRVCVCVCVFWEKKTMITLLLRVIANIYESENCIHSDTKRKTERNNTEKREFQWKWMNILHETISVCIYFSSSEVVTRF